LKVLLIGAKSIGERPVASFQEKDHRLLHHEREEIANAAASQGLSLSSFIASAALKEARKTSLQERPK
jgi:uncharacterized protein (DUF1778 family)